MLLRKCRDLLTGKEREIDTNMVFCLFESSIEPATYSLCAIPPEALNFYNKMEEKQGRSFQQISFGDLPKHPDDIQDFETKSAEEKEKLRGAYEAIFTNEMLNENPLTTQELQDYLGIYLEKTLEKIEDKKLICLDELLSNPGKKEVITFFESIARTDERDLQRLDKYYKMSDIESLIQHLLNQNVRVEYITASFKIVARLSKYRLLQGTLNAKFFSILTKGLLARKPGSEDILSIVQSVTWFVNCEKLNLNPLLEDLLKLNQSKQYSFNGQINEPASAFACIMLELGRLAKTNQLAIPISVELLTSLINVFNDDHTGWGLPEEYHYASYYIAVLDGLNQLAKVNQLSAPISTDILDLFSYSYDESLSFLRIIASLIQNNQMRGKLSMAFCKEMGYRALIDFEKENFPERVCFVIPFFAKLANTNQLADGWEIPDIGPSLDALLKFKNFSTNPSNNTLISNLIVALADLARHQRLNNKNKLNVLLPMLVNKLNVATWSTEQLQELQTQLTLSQYPDNLLSETFSATTAATSIVESSAEIMFFQSQSSTELLSSHSVSVSKTPNT